MGGVPTGFVCGSEGLDLKSLEEELGDTDTEFDAVGDDEESVNVNALKAGSEDAPVVRLVNMVLIDAIR